MSFTRVTFILVFVMQADQCHSHRYSSQTNPYLNAEQPEANDFASLTLCLFFCKMGCENSNLTLT